MGDDDDVKFCIRTPIRYEEVVTECGDVIPNYTWGDSDSCENCGGRILEDSSSYGDCDR